MKRLFALLAIFASLLVPLSIPAEEGFTSDFGDLSGWRLVNFDEEKPPTEFDILTVEERDILQIVADDSSSMLIREEPINVYETPYLSWKWSLLDPLEGADLRSIFSEDTSIRILVTFRDDLDNLPWWLRVWARQQLSKHGEMPPTSALNYVWSRREYGEEPFKSVYSRRIQFIVMNSGSDALGEWRTHRVDVVEDYRRAMGVDPPAEAFIAVMSDADNTGERSEAWLEYLRATAE